MEIIKTLAFLALIGILVPLALLPIATLLAHLFRPVKGVLDWVFGLIGSPFRVVGHFWRWAGDQVAEIAQSLKEKSASRQGADAFGAWMLVRPIVEVFVVFVLAVAYAVFLADTLTNAGIGSGHLASGGPVLFAAIFANTVGLWKFGEALWGDPPDDSAAPPRVLGWIGLGALVLFDLSLAVITVYVRNGGEAGWWTGVPRVTFLVMLAMATILVGLRLFRVADALGIIILGLVRAVVRLLEVGAQMLFFAVDVMRKVLLTLLLVVGAIGRGFVGWLSRTSLGQRWGIGHIDDTDIDDLADIVDPVIFGLLPFLDPNPPAPRPAGSAGNGGVTGLPPTMAPPTVPLIPVVVDPGDRARPKEPVS